MMTLPCSLRFTGLQHEVLSATGNLLVLGTVFTLLLTNFDFDGVSKELLQHGLHYP